MTLFRLNFKNQTNNTHKNNNIISQFQNYNNLPSNNKKYNNGKGREIYLFFCQIEHPIRKNKVIFE